MENVLSIDSLPLEEKRPVICPDEMPAQLSGEMIVGAAILDSV